MKIHRIRIENFRNFRSVDVAVGEHAVIVGENKVGKSNFLHALRLVLDPSLPDSARQLRPEDFWDGLARPISLDAKIRVELDLVEFDENENKVALLCDFLVSESPMTARITYEFRKVENEYEFILFGGDREEQRVPWDVRRRLAMDLIPALRDAESDLANWRRSPLRPLLAKMADKVSSQNRSKLASSLEAAMREILDLAEVKELTELLSGTLKELVGGSQASDVQLGLAPTDADRLLRSLRILIDGGVRGIGDASLGVANTLYLTLKLLEISQLAADGLRDHTFLMIEEPEAHLHPHVQRSVFSSILRNRRHLPTKARETASRTVLLTTHSPHIASIAPLRSLLLLRSTQAGTVAVSANDIALAKSDEEDLERYLNVTRAEMLFARAVLLVEGDAEVFMIPQLAAFQGLDLDALGITVCSVAGTNFAPHAKLLKALAVPFALLTDFDPQKDGKNLGERRVADLVQCVATESGRNWGSDEECLVAAPGLGIFLNSATFEIDLLRSGRAVSMARSLVELAPSDAARERAEAWQKQGSVPTADEARFLKDIEGIGKGRYAQRLASTIQKEESGPPLPKYVSDAFAFLNARLAVE